jgi:hypothetical protein
MADIHLRADTEAKLKKALPWAVEDGEWLVSGEGYVLDLIGPIMTVEPVMDGETLVTPAQWDTKFHANLRTWGGFEPSIPSANIVTPAHPKRVFA